MERYIVMRFLVGVSLLFLVIFFIINIANGGNDSTKSTKSDNTPLVLSEQNNDTTSVQFIVRGKINALEDHRSIQFTISQSKRVAQMLSGYDGKVIKTISLKNTANSYEQLLFSLENQGYLRELKKPTVTEPRGACASGREYTYKLRNFSIVEKELWSTSCSNKQGTSSANRSSVNQLFEKQFPNYREFSRGVVL